MGLGFVYCLHHKLRKSRWKRTSNKQQKQNPLKQLRWSQLRWRNIVEVESLAAVVVDVEARTVSGVLPGLLAHLDRSPDLLEVAGHVENPDHAEKDGHMSHWRDWISNTIARSAFKWNQQGGYYQDTLQTPNMTPLRLRCASKIFKFSFKKRLQCSGPTGAVISHYLLNKPGSSIEESLVPTPASSELSGLPSAELKNTVIFNIGMNQHKYRFLPIKYW